MFKRMKLKRYFFCIFASIIVLAGIITSVSISGFSSARSNMQEMLDTTLAADSAAKVCRIESNRAGRALYEMLMNENKTEQRTRQDQITASFQVIQENMQVLRENSQGREAVVQAYMTAFEDWMGDMSTAIQQIQKGDLAGARSTIQRQVNVSLDVMGAAAADIEEATQSMAQADEDYNRSLLTFFLILSCISFVLLLVVCVLCGVRATRNMLQAATQAQEAVRGLARGDLSTRMEYEAQNEFGELADSINGSFQELRRYIQAIGESMNAFSQGDFSQSSDVEFRGDFAEIRQDIETFQNKMSATLSDFAVSSDQVNAGASQVADSAQALAQGATEQASSSQELAATIADISTQLNQTSDYSGQANETGKLASQVMANSQQEMKQLNDAIQDIALQSEKIQRIVKTIDDIAFQTNILALNAAVEAARAGAAGKGFAVVADEVRNLAAKSADAAKTTTELISATIASVDRGTTMANRTGEVFREMEHYSQEILGMIDKIAQAAAQQSESVSQISTGVDQITSVIQQNSAASEQSAAASEELSSQADMMRQLVAQFKLLAR